MDGMHTAPVIVRGKGQHAEYPPRPVVDPVVAEKRTVAATVLDHEQADEKPGRGYGEDEASPIAMQDGPPANPHSNTNGTMVRPSSKALSRRSSLG